MKNNFQNPCVSCKDLPLALSAAFFQQDRKVGGSGTRIIFLGSAGNKVGNKVGAPPLYPPPRLYQHACSPIFVEILDTTILQT